MNMIKLPSKKMVIFLSLLLLHGIKIWAIDWTFTGGIFSGVIESPGTYTIGNITVSGATSNGCVITSPGSLGISPGTNLTVTGTITVNNGGVLTIGGTPTNPTTVNFNGNKIIVMPGGKLLINGNVTVNMNANTYIDVRSDCVIATACSPVPLPGGIFNATNNVVIQSAVSGGVPTGWKGISVWGGSNSNSGLISTYNFSQRWNYAARAVLINSKISGAKMALVNANVFGSDVRGKFTAGGIM